jgi:hypothetical protein
MKGSFLPLKGKCILYIHFSISLFVRVFAILLCYTPVLGLFSINHHKKMKVDVEAKSFSIEPLVYDVTDNDKLVTFQQAWGNFSLAVPDVYPMLDLFSLLPPLLFLLHWFLSFFLLSRLYKKNKRPKLQILLQSLYTIIFPPVFVDWETIYRDSRGEVSIIKCVEPQSYSEKWPGEGQQTPPGTTRQP